MFGDVLPILISAIPATTTVVTSRKPADATGETRLAPLSMKVLTSWINRKGSLTVARLRPRRRNTQSRARLCPCLYMPRKIKHVLLSRGSSCWRTNPWRSRFTRAQLRNLVGSPPYNTFSNKFSTSQIWAKNWVCFAKQQPGRAIQKIHST